MRWCGVLSAVVALAAVGCSGGQAPAPERPPATTAAPAAGGPAWRGLAAAPSPRTEVAAAAVGGRIWVVGGYAPDGATLATAEVYDTAADTWARGPDLPVAVNHAMAATLDGMLYVAGGNDGNRPSTQLARLDGDRWRTLAPLPQGRAAGGLVALDGRLYLVGGVVEGGLAADTQVYDPAADRWASAPGLPTPREHLGAAASAGKVYVVGGRVGGTGNNLGAAEAFDPASGRWTAVAELPTPRGGLAATATAGGLVAVGDTVYVLAGGPRPGLHTSAANEAIDLGE
jgi:N-acetylneuraminic acid mutarotase